MKTSSPMKLVHTDLSAQMLLLMNVTSHSNSLQGHKVDSCNKQMQTTDNVDDWTLLSLFLRRRPRLLLGVDDLGHAVGPCAALRPGARLHDAVLARLQHPHTQTGLQLLGRDTQQVSGPLQEALSRERLRPGPAPPRRSRSSVSHLWNRRPGCKAATHPMKEKKSHFRAAESRLISARPGKERGVRL